MNFIILCNRIQCMRVGKQFSNWSSVLSGIPQGSVLGPLLFVIYINDMSQYCLKLKSLYFFADDAKCFAIIRSLLDCEHFQQNLVSISEWSKNWQLKLAVEKCKILSFSDHVEIISYDYSINSIPLIRVSDISDLGVIFSSNLSFSMHVDDICNRARKKPQ